MSVPTVGYTGTGYIPPNNGTSWRDQNNNNATGFFVPGRDSAYASTLTSAGVVMFNGNYHDSTTSSYGLYCSATYLPYIGAPNNADDAYLVYPDYGFQLFNQSNYDLSSTYTYAYINTSNNPVLFYTSNNNWNDSSGTQIYIGDNSGNAYGCNQTSSAYIFYRGVRINVTGLSS